LHDAEVINVAKDYAIEEWSSNKKVSRQPRQGTNRTKS
jgi:hypothetical protein